MGQARWNRSVAAGAFGAALLLSLFSFGALAAAPRFVSLTEEENAAVLAAALVCPGTMP